MVIWDCYVGACRRLGRPSRDDSCAHSRLQLRRQPRSCYHPYLRSHHAHPSSLTFLRTRLIPTFSQLNCTPTQITILSSKAAASSTPTPPRRHPQRRHPRRKNRPHLHRPAQRTPRHPRRRSRRRPRLHRPAPARPGSRQPARESLRRRHHRAGNGNRRP